MNLGLGKKEDRTKTIILGVLLVGGAYSLYTNVFSGDSSAPATKQTVVTTPESGATNSLTGNSSLPPALRRGSGGRAGEFRPKLRGGRPEDRVDPTKMDPTLKLNLLTRVQAVPMEGGARNIFAFGAAAAAPTGPIPVVPKVQLAGKAPAGVPVIPLNVPGQPAPAPPIPFKYYGYSSVKGESRKRAFFLDGEDIIVAWEGDMIKNRYRVVHIGLTSVEMEDTQFKNKQSLQLAEDLAG